ncbi:MAG: ATP-binding protein, partial [Flavobacteriales bacterium]|nr:ATP-binding protein [Flavobacteriales bacterium]
KSFEQWDELFDDSTMTIAAIDRLVHHAELEVKFEGKEVLRPDFWGGYALIPNYFEFWQGRPSRLHDRITYEKQHGSRKWFTKRLYP